MQTSSVKECGKLFGIGVRILRALARDAERRVAGSALHRAEHILGPRIINNNN